MEEAVEGTGPERGPAPTEALHPAGGATGLLERTRRTAELVRMLGPREVRVRYRQSVLDLSWALITPIVIAAVYGYILTRSFDVTGSCGPYISTAWTGLVLWTFFSTALGSGVASLISSGDLVTKVYFPREAIPLSVVAASLADLAVGLVTVFVVLAVQQVEPSVTMLGIVLPLLVLLVWTAALTIFLSVLSAFARDFVHGVNLLLRVGFFATPVMYEASFIPPAFAWTARYNPIAAVLTETRRALFCQEWPSLSLLGVHLLVGAALLVGAVVYTRSVESAIADVI